jgi:hypothetical protein
MNPAARKQRPDPPAGAPRIGFIAWWRTGMQISRLLGRGNPAAAERLCQQLLDRDPTDWFALMILVHCCERQGRLPEALDFAERCACNTPTGLMALQTATRLAFAIGDHDKVDAYVRRALALPEVQNEIPKESAVPRALLLLMRALARLPWLRRRIRHEEIAQMELGFQTQQLKVWKTWAQEYLAWHAGEEPRLTPTDNLVH